MHPVSSNNISSVGYENGILHIQFRKGGLYAYHNVPESLYLNFMSAPSLGTFFHMNIKGRYGDTKLR